MILHVLLNAHFTNTANTLYTWALFSTRNAIKHASYLVIGHIVLWNFSAHVEIITHVLLFKLIISRWLIPFFTSFLLNILLYAKTHLNLSSFFG